MAFFSPRSLSLLTPGRGLSSLCDFSGKEKRHFRGMGQWFVSRCTVMAPAKSVIENIHLRVHLSRAEGDRGKQSHANKLVTRETSCFKWMENHQRPSEPPEQSHHQVAFLRFLHLENTILDFSLANV